MSGQKKNKYQEHIVSTKEHEVFLHRTSRDLVDKIMKNGLKTNDLLSTASHQSVDLASAEIQYQETHKGNDAVIVIKIPSKIYKSAIEEMNGDFGLHDEIGYFNEELGSFVIHPKHIHGWISKETNEYVPNPNHATGFDYLKGKRPSEIEKTILEEYKNRKPKQEERPLVKLTKEGLPPPPDETNVLP